MEEFFVKSNYYGPSDHMFCIHSSILIFLEQKAMFYYSRW